MAPRFLHTPHSVSQVVAGNDVNIKCTAIGSPKPITTWSLNSKPVGSIAFLKSFTINELEYYTI